MRERVCEKEREFVYVCFCVCVCVCVFVCVCGLEIAKRSGLGLIWTAAR